jgi:hypothetical protein
VCGDTAITVVQRDKHWLGSYGNRDSKRQVKFGGGKQFELLLVLINDLEEPFGLTLKTLIQKYVLYLLCATYFGATVVDVIVFTVEK